MSPVQDFDKTSSRIIEAIDGGQYRRAEKLLRESSGVAVPLAAVLSAEVETYFGRLDRAAELLVAAKANLEDIRLAGRYALAYGQYGFSRGALQEAEEALETAYHIYRLLNATFYMARSLQALAAVRRLSSGSAAAEALLLRAREAVSGEPANQIERYEFLSGQIDLQMAACREDLGDLDAALPLLASAIELLRRSEEGRFYARALDRYGFLLVRMGRFQDSLTPLHSAHRILSELSLPAELASSTVNLADALIRVKSYEEAEHRILAGLAAAKETGDPRIGFRLMASLADLHLAKGDGERAGVEAERLIEAGVAAASPADEAEGRMLLARVMLARAEVSKAEKELKACIELGRKAGSSVLEGRACLYLAEALVPTRAIEGREYLNRVTQLLVLHRDAALDLDIQRISDRYRGERITITTDNKLVINGHLLPTWIAAKEAVERFLLKNALEQSQDNQTKAGQILGITKVHVHDKRKQYGL